jgi:hypothetical protein
MKIVLIHPPHPNSTDDHLDPPYGLMLIASYLREHDVSIIDLSGEGEIPYADFYGITAYISTLGITKGLVEMCHGSRWGSASLSLSQRFFLCRSCRHR